MSAADPSTMGRGGDGATDRRRHARAVLGLPVRVHFAGRTLPLTVELIDVSMGGCYFRGASAPAGAKVAFGFVMPGRRLCVARGQVVRLAERGFAIAIERANPAVIDFVAGLTPSASASASVSAA